MSVPFASSGGQINVCAPFGTREQRLGGNTRAHRQVVQCANTWKWFRGIYFCFLSNIVNLKSFAFLLSFFSRTPIKTVMCVSEALWQVAFINMSERRTNTFSSHCSKEHICNIQPPNTQIARTIHMKTSKKRHEEASCYFCLQHCSLLATATHSEQQLVNTWLHRQLQTSPFHPHLIIRESTGIIALKVDFIRSLWDSDIHDFLHLSHFMIFSFYLLKVKELFFFSSKMNTDSLSLSLLPFLSLTVYDHCCKHSLIFKCHVILKQYSVN